MLPLLAEAMDPTASKILNIVGIILCLIVVYIIIVWIVFPHTTKKQLEVLTKRAESMDRRLENLNARLDVQIANTEASAKWLERSDVLLEAIEKNTRKDNANSA